MGSPCVLKYRLYHYLGIARPTDQEMIVLEKIVCYSELRKGGETPDHWGHRGKHPGQPGAGWEL